MFTVYDDKRAPETLAARSLWRTQAAFCFFESHPNIHEASTYLIVGDRDRSLDHTVISDKQISSVLGPPKQTNVHQGVGDLDHDAKTVPCGNQRPHSAKTEEEN